MRAWILLIPVMLLAACGTDSTRDAAPRTHFDVGRYADRAGERIIRGFDRMEKTVELNDSTEHRDLGAPDSASVAQALAVLRTANVNRPALLGRYSIEPTEAGTLYLASDSDLLIRSLWIGADSSITARTVERNPLYTALKRIVFVPDSMIVVRGRQSIPGRDADRYIITTTWRRAPGE